ncbi:uncharacterized protein ACHE_51225S [Aspergillus chevalieri]|uniref:Box C/D snoRNA protein 1 n=1 Tax=Aspergillus chevalieri TaxID=182096 RepID=A0A7R7VSJ6_ASPCH|nr:uncharacterized protein ACHE_51225S [Aspergillus chevalieri]BCR90027.1 hypothetical protein ACHE_51225S [Aspergillus chevalieri]
MSETPGGDPLLSELCTICHINAPKYRCPRCSTRTCSLPCSRRHKTWSQCSGVRDPAAYLRRNELATPSAFDRDFNFITGIERSMERADRDAENRGISIDRQAEEGEEMRDGGRKRKRPNEGLVKGEAGFLRGAQSSEVNVIRAPKGMTRNKQNTSRWHPKHKCLIWTMEWIAPDGEKKIRTCLESCRVAEAYDRFYPLPKEERNKDQAQDQGQPPEQVQGQKQEDNQQPQSELEPQSTIEMNSQSAEQELPVQPKQDETQPEPSDPSPSDLQENEITPHRDVYFYLHRPRTATRQPVLIPLPPAATFTSALRKRTVLEFPTIYVLPDSPDILRATSKENASHLLEEEYVQPEKPGEDGELGGLDGEGAQGIDHSAPSVDLGQVDEKKVLEVLKQDLFEPDSAVGP